MASKKPIRRITFDDLPQSPAAKKSLQSLQSGPSHLIAKMDQEAVEIEIKIELPVARNGKVRQDLLQTLKVLKEAEKFITDRRKFFDGHVRERLQADQPVEDGLLTAKLIANRRRNPNWKQRSVEMHAKLLREAEGLSKKESLSKAEVEAGKFLEDTEYSEYAPKVSVKVRK